MEISNESDDDLYIIHFGLRFYGQKTTWCVIFFLKKISIFKVSFQFQKDVKKFLDPLKKKKPTKIKVQISFNYNFDGFQFSVNLKRIAFKILKFLIAKLNSP